MKNKFEIPTLSNSQTLIDTHCHLDMPAYSDEIEMVISEATKNGIEKIVTIGIDLPSSMRAVALAKRHSSISATIGVHPHDIDNMKNQDYEKLKRLWSNNKDQIVGFGEIGLDYVKQYSEPKNQRLHFCRQLELAAELDLPVIIHNREANEDTLSILKTTLPQPQRGIMHCFSGDYEFAKQVLNLGMFISIPGIVTFKNARVLHEVVKRVPLDRIVCETDGPFLSPHPHRGKQNRPEYLLFTAQKIAELKSITIDEVAEATTNNAKNLFNL